MEDDSWELVEKLINMTEENKEENTSIEDNKLMSHIQWEIDRKTSHIRSFENRLLAALSIDSVIVGILATFYSLNPTIKVHEKCLLIAFGAILAIIIGIQLYLWWPRKSSERESKLELQDRFNLEDLNNQLNTMDASLYCRARLVYTGLVSFAIQITLLFIIILGRIV